MCQQLYAFRNNLVLTETKSIAAPEGTRLQVICPKAQGYSWWSLPTNRVLSAIHQLPSKVGQLLQVQDKKEKRCMQLEWIHKGV